MLFKNRVDAGKRLASLLRLYAHRPDVSVIALPRGGVPVAAEIARELNAPLDVLVVRKLGVPRSEEMAMGAITSGNFQYLNDTLIQRLNIPAEAISAVIQREQRELARREQAYRDDRPPLNLRDRTVILVDDGLATGATMRVAIEAVQQQQPKEFTVAVPVAAKEICHQLGTQVDHIVCAETPQPFHAVGLWYQEFDQTSDEEVQTLLDQARNRVLEAAGRDR
jgi:putative phosphoribosyl transferase